MDSQHFIAPPPPSLHLKISYQDCDGLLSPLVPNLPTHHSGHSWMSSACPEGSERRSEDGRSLISTLFQSVCKPGQQLSQSK